MKLETEHNEIIKKSDEILKKLGMIEEDEDGTKTNTNQ